MGVCVRIYSWRLNGGSTSSETPERKKEKEKEKESLCYLSPSIQKSQNKKKESKPMITLNAKEESS